MNKIVTLAICITLTFIVSTPTGILEQNDYSFQQTSEKEIDILNVKEIYSINNQNSSKVKVEVKYVVGVKPPVTYYYTKTRNGITEAGTLTLDQIRYMSDATYAVYVGYIYPVE